MLVNLIPLVEKSKDTLEELKVNSSDHSKMDMWVLIQALNKLNIKSLSLDLARYFDDDLV